MSLIKLQARNYQVLINDQDVSDYCKGDSGGYLSIREDLLDFSGHIGCRGQLVLRPPVGGSIDLDPRTNCNFARGAKVKIRISPVDSNTLYDYRTLRVLQDPSPPSEPDRSITLELGDLLTLLDFKRPEQEEATFDPGTTTTRTTLINQLLASVGAPAMAGSIPEYPVTYPPNRGNDGPIRQACKLAAEAGYCLWVNQVEAIVPVNLRLSAVPLLWEFRVGGPNASDYSYKPASSRIPPFERLKVFGIGISSDKDSSCIKEYKVEEETIGAYPDPILGLISVIILDKIVIIKIDSCLRITTEIISESIPRQLILGFGQGNDLYPLALTLSLYEVKQKFYDSFGRIIKESINRLEPRVKIAREYSGDFPFTMEQSLLSNISYQYDLKGRLTNKKEENFEPLARISIEFSGDFPFSLTKSIERTEKWIYGENSETTYTRQTLVPRISVTNVWNPYLPPSSQYAFSLVLKESFVSLSLDDSPRDTSVSFSQTQVLEQFLEAEIDFPGNCNPEFRNTEKALEFQTAVSNNQLEEVGRIWGRIWLGRQWAYEVVTFLPLGLLASPRPIFGANVTEFHTGYQYQAIAEGHSLVLGQDRCLLGVHFLSLGGTRSASPIPGVPIPTPPTTDGSVITNTPLGTIPGVVVINPPFEVTGAAIGLINLVGESGASVFYAQPDDAEGYINLVGEIEIDMPDPSPSPSPSPSLDECQIFIDRVDNEFSEFSDYYCSNFSSAAEAWDADEGSYVGFYGAELAYGDGDCESFVFDYWVAVWEGNCVMPDPSPSPSEE